MINCADAIRQLWDYLEGEVSPEDRLRVSEHVEACRRCCGEVEFLAELRRFVAAAHLEMPVDVGTRLDALLSSMGGSRGRPDAQG
jgi:anti-sigma factor (TIGR02949 family)